MLTKYEWQELLVLGRAYEYDANGNITIEKAVTDTGKVMFHRTYTYNANGNLINISEWKRGDI